MNRRFHVLGLLTVICLIGVITRHWTNNAAKAEGPELVAIYPVPFAPRDLIRAKHVLKDQRITVHFDSEGRIYTDPRHLQIVTTLLAEARLPRESKAGTQPFRLTPEPSMPRHGNLLGLTSPEFEGAAYTINYRPARFSYPTVAERLSYLDALSRGHGMSPPKIEVRGLPKRARPMAKAWELAREILQTERRAIGSITAALPAKFRDKAVVQVQCEFLAVEIKGEDTIGSAPSGELVAPLRVKSIKVILLTDGLDPKELHSCRRLVTSAAGLDKARGDTLEVDNDPWEP